MEIDLKAKCTLCPGIRFRLNKTSYSFISVFKGLIKETSSHKANLLLLCAPTCSLVQAAYVELFKLRYVLFLLKRKFHETDLKLNSYRVFCTKFYTIV